MSVESEAPRRAAKLFPMLLPALSAALQARDDATPMPSPLLIKSPQAGAALLDLSCRRVERTTAIHPGLTYYTLHFEAPGVR